jgi:D-tyrosyl-tRNA(Tyr) deacylase
MRVVIQRVKSAAVEIQNKNHSSIGQGLLIFLGVENDDGEDDISWLCKKIIRLRIFDDKDGIMNLSVADVDGKILVISQFTLHAKTKKGNRPSYIKAARPDVAIPLYEKFVEKLGFYLEKEIKTGEFGALMQVSLVNDGPVTIIIDTKNKDY